MEFIKHFVVAGLLFVAIDAVWLTLMAKRFYRKQIGSLLADKPKFGPAAIFYLIYMVGLVVFALDPALDENSLGYAVGHGALLGLVMYATYDLTNQSTLKEWPAKLSIVDMAWGALITGTVTSLAYLIFS